MKKEVSFSIFDDLSLLEFRLFDRSLSNQIKEMRNYCDKATSCISCSISNLCVLSTTLARDLQKRIDELCKEDE